MRKKLFIFLTLISSLLLIVGCIQQTQRHMGEDMMSEELEEEMEERMGEVMGEELAEEMEEHMDEVLEENVNWKETELTDVKTGNKFKISDFKGKPILLESFAVWCPTCKRQQDKIKELHEEVGDSVISISLDTDPNEEDAQVISHANRHGFDWSFAVSPIQMTKSLIDEFGVNVVNAPQAPTILICDDQSARLLDRGVKSADTLKLEIEKGC